MQIETHERREDGAAFPFLVWRLPDDCLVLSSAPVGGGLGPRDWVINAQVHRDYARTDLEMHIDELRRHVGLAAPGGVGMLTGVAVDRATRADFEGVEVTSTVGVTMPEWAASPESAAALDRVAPGTINVMAWVPVALSDAALVNAAITATEAKTQALVEAGINGSGTATDAVCIACPTADTTERFAGPRSRWGRRLALAVHATVRDGVASGHRGP